MRLDRRRTLDLEVGGLFNPGWWYECPKMQRCINKFEPQRNAASRHDPARRQSYRITNNKLYNNKQKNFTGLANGGMRVANEDFVATLRGNMFVMDSATQGGRLAVHKLPINPGDGRMFPWLSAVARRYEHYSSRNWKYCTNPQSARTLVAMSQCAPFMTLLTQPQHRGPYC
jgi:hypothetical protein